MNSLYLLDANVLIALAVAEHEHHDLAHQWLHTVSSVAVCPIVQGALARFLLRCGEQGETVAIVLNQLRQSGTVEFWSDDLDFSLVKLSDVRVHKQVTDVYLATLASAHGAKLATFDRALCAFRPEQTQLIH